MRTRERREVGNQYAAVITVAAGQLPCHIISTIGVGRIVGCRTALRDVPLADARLPDR
jgi:hypothetical protein